MRRKSLMFWFYILVGLLLGFIILHPVSYVIIGLFQEGRIGFLEIMRTSFALSHINMALYFTLLGGFIGLLYALYSNLEKNILSEFTDLNIQIEDRSRELLEQIDKESADVTIFIKQIWPTLNKIQTGVNLILDDKNELSRHRKKDILSVTKEHISSVFNLIEIMISHNKTTKTDLSKKKIH